MRVPDLLRQFAQPDARFSPAPLWWWSGRKLEITRLRRQLDALAEMGIHQVVIINLAPSGTLFGCDADDPPFLSEPWWQFFQQVCDHARSIGTLIWFYDQIGFSGASYQAQIATAHPQFIGQQLRHLSVEGVGPLQIRCPAAPTPIAAFAVPHDRPTAVRYLPVDGRSVSIHAPTPSRLTIVFAVRQGYDFFSHAACDQLLETVHRQFHRRLPQHLGNTIVGSFQDELADMPTWSANFPDTFAEKFGYRLEPVIHRLFEPGDFESRRTRVHYHAHRADLAERAFFKPFFDWHESHGLQCGFDQQSPAREARVIGSVEKYADYTQTHRWYAIPGCDLHGNAKLHSSIAWMNGRRRVWLEGFHSTGWGGTIADTLDWLLPNLRAGANFYNPHAVYYSTRKGWWEWAPPSTCWRQPYARHYRPFADMIARLTNLLSHGITQARIGVLFPTATVQSALGPQQTFPDALAADRTLHEIIGSMRWHQQKLGPLDEMGLDFHILDERSLQDHLEKIRVVVLPSVTFLHDASVRKLMEFARSGGKIIAVGSETIETDAGGNICISSLAGAITIPSAAELPAALQSVERCVRCTLPTLHRVHDDLHILFIPAVAGMATEVRWPGWFDPMEHTTIVPHRYQSAVDLSLPDDAKTVWRFDPRTGASQPLQTIAAPDGRTLRLDFQGSPFAVLVWSDHDDFDVSGSTVPRAGRTVLQLSDSWTCEFVPTLPQTAGDLRHPHTTDFSWSREDSTESQTVRATFGVRAWLLDPKAPAPLPVIYSPKFGILQDEIHKHTLGPKGHVPEEFIDLGRRREGEQIAVRSGVISDAPRDIVLAFAANAAKSVIVNHQQLQQHRDEYLWLAPIRLIAGRNAIRFHLSARRDGVVRMFWCLLQPGAAANFQRPEKILPPHAPTSGSTLRFIRRFTAADATAPGQVKVCVAAMAVVLLDGKTLGRQGGFDPYRPMLRGQIYPLPPLAAGEHELCLELTAPQTAAPLIVDLRCPPLTIFSDAHWTVRGDDGVEQSVTLHAKQEPDAAAWHLWRRPHPLPQTGWLSDAPPCTDVLDLPLIPPCDHPVSQHLRWTIPPGAISMTIPLAEHDQATLWIDDLEHAIDAALPAADGRPARSAHLRIRSPQLGGGLLTGPVTYRFDRGQIKPGSWLDHGLGSYSGAMRMRQRFTATRPDAILDLGHVRGSVEAWINGHHLGIRCIAPYRFELKDLLVDQSNQLELLIAGTLANHLSTWSPTSWWSPDQLAIGIFGPVRILCGE